MLKLFRHGIRLLFVCLPVAAWSQDALTLQAAVERSLKDNPELKAVGFALSAQAARGEQAQARPSLEVGVLVENAAGSGLYKGVDATETTLTIGWVWERGVRDDRVRAADAAMSAAQSEAQVRRLDVASETARRFVALLAHQHELQELQRTLASAEQSHASVQQRVAAAKAPEAEAARSFAQLARMRLELEHEEHELLTAAARLVAMWGQQVINAEHPAVVADGDLLAVPAVAEFASLQNKLQGNPNVAQVLTVERLREAELSLATAQSRPAWRFSAGVRRLEASDDAALVFGVTAPLANRRQSQGAISLARSQTELARAHTEALRVHLGSELFALYQEMKHAHTEVTTLRDEVLPRMQTALEQSQYAYERGRYSYMEWAAAQREVTEMRRAYIIAAANAHRHRIEIERLIGATLPNTSP
jgi:cobalt-zinc-cadmium efflux system outer membrane protein